LDDSLQRQSVKIQRILKNYGVPVVKLGPVAVKPQAWQSTQ